jgi:threonine synthase
MKLVCIECKKSYLAEEIRYRCDCGNLLEIISDLKKFNRSPKQWKQHFENNNSKPPFLRYKDILLPDLPDNQVILLNEGDTPLYPATKEMQEYFKITNLKLKHEGMNPTLSFKDRGMVAAVSWAKHLKVKLVACASTGDTSASMAAYAAYARIKRVVLLPEGKVSIEQLSQPISSGAITLELDTDFDGCMKLVQELTKKYPIYLLNSMNSIRIEGQKAIGIETLHQLNWEVPDWFIVPVGNAGNISALGKGLRELHELGIINKLPRLAGIEVKAANPLYISYKNNWAPLEPVQAKETVASAIQIGNPVSFKKAVRELKHFKGVMEQVSEQEVKDAKAVVDASGIPICPNSAAAMAGLKKLIDNNIIKQEESVVAIMTAHGGKFSKAVIDYHKGNNKFSNKTKYLKANLETIEETLGLK